MGVCALIGVRMSVCITAATQIRTQKSGWIYESSKHTGKQVQIKSFEHHNNPRLKFIMKVFREKSH